MDAVNLTAMPDTAIDPVLGWGEIQKIASGPTTGGGRELRRTGPRPFRFVLALALLATLVGASTYPAWFWAAEHVAISGCGPISGYFVLRDVCKFSKPVALIVPLGLTAGACAWKELAMDGRIDAGDVLWNVAGLTVATVVLVGWGQ